MEKNVKIVIYAIIFLIILLAIRVLITINLTNKRRAREETGKLLFLTNIYAFKAIKPRKQRKRRPGGLQN